MLQLEDAKLIRLKWVMLIRHEQHGWRQWKSLSCGGRMLESIIANAESSILHTPLSDKWHWINKDAVAITCPKCIYSLNCKNSFYYVCPMNNMIITSKTYGIFLLYAQITYQAIVIYLGRFPFTQRRYQHWKCWMNFFYSFMIFW